MNKKHLFPIIAFLVLVLVLGGFIYTQEQILTNGQEVILKTRPVDPRDLFRGEYVILRYEIEAAEMVTDQAQLLQDGKQIYLKLETDSSGVAQVVAVQTTEPDFSDGVWLAGEVSYNTVRFRDLEQFYVPEGAGLAIEDLREELHVRITIHDGEARVVALLDQNLEEINPKDYIEQ